MQRKIIDFKLWKELTHTQVNSFHRIHAIRTCYIKYGWKDYSKLGDRDVTLFGLHEFILEFKKLLENTNYSKEVRGNLESEAHVLLGGGASVNTDGSPDSQVTTIIYKI